MLTFFGRQQQYCDGVSRRDFLRVGALAVGGLTMADVLRLQAEGASAGQSPARGKSVIMIYLPGGPPHMDMYDMKPMAAREFRGELNPINTNVPGVEICELMPRQAKIMDKLAILRGVKFVDEHSAHMVMTGYPDRVRRPCFGSMVSYRQGRQNGLPPYVSLMNNKDAEDPEYCGAAHRPFVPSGPGLDNLSLTSGVSLDRLDNRKELLKNLDTIRREVDYRGAMTGVDAFTVRALDMITTKEAREAFDVEKEPRDVQQRYGRENRDFLRARRLVEAGVSVVTLATGGWDTHGDNFNSMRKQLPRLDQGIHALVTDLHERGLDKDVAVVMWGEFGRTPRVNSGAGRDHWAPAGFALMAGGGMKMGQAIGETDARGERPIGRGITPSNVLATLYRHMGIDTQATLPDHNGRPMYVLEDREVVAELV
ncbi:MAG: DUF1501 domain-containing protein [Planctomycetota bacterium]|nr:MAG: DUF1501 domain-containing protein [Planctomycetota bacterium]